MAPKSEKPSSGRPRKYEKARKGPSSSHKKSGGPTRAEEPGKELSLAGTGGKPPENLAVFGVPAPEGKPAVEAVPASREPSAEKERLVLEVEEIREIVANQLKEQGVAIEKLDIVPEWESIRLVGTIEKNGATVGIDGLIRNTKNGLAIAQNDLKVDANFIVKAVAEPIIRNNINRLSSEIKSFLQRKYQKPVASIQIAGDSLEVEFESPASSQSNAPAEGQLSQEIEHAPDRPQAEERQPTHKIDLLHPRGKTPERKKELRTEPERELSPEKLALASARERYAKAYAALRKGYEEDGIVFTKSKAGKASAHVRGKSAVDPQEFEARMNRVRETAPIHAGDLEILERYNRLDKEGKVQFRVEHGSDHGGDETGKAIVRSLEFDSALLREGFVALRLSDEIYYHEAAKADYDRAKLAYANTLRDPSEVFQKIIVDERLALDEAKVGTFPPKERALTTRILLSGAARWAKIPRLQRVLISSLLIGGGSGLIGGAGLAFTAGLIGKRILVGGVSAIASQGVGKLLDRAWNEYGGEKDLRRSNEDIAEEVLEVSLNLDSKGLAELEKRYKEAGDTFAERKAAFAYLKGFAMILTGIAGGFAGRAGLSLLEGHGSQVASTAVSSPKSAGLPNQQPARLSSLEATPTPKPVGWHPRGAETSAGGTASADHATGAGAGIESAAKHDVPETAATGAEPATPVPHAESSVAAHEGFGKPDWWQDKHETASLLKQGEGIWNPVKRLLKLRAEDDPDGFLREYNAHAEQYKWQPLRAEDLQDKAKIGEALNRETAARLVEGKYIRPDGTETWIKRPGVHVRLDADGKIAIENEADVAYSHATPASGAAQVAERAPEHAVAPAVLPVHEGHIAEHLLTRDEVSPPPVHAPAPAPAPAPPAPTAGEAAKHVFADEHAHSPTEEQLRWSSPLTEYGVSLGHALGFNSRAELSIFQDAGVRRFLEVIPSRAAGLEHIKAGDGITWGETITLPITESHIRLAEAVRSLRIPDQDLHDMTFGYLFSHIGGELEEAYGTIKK